tara:strand:- start:13796 stop:14089 length:294 start_codon:yes stop_codon:yes gene_type:complete
MKVKIAYTVDLDEIPVETAKMLGNISPKVEKFSKILANCKKQIALDDMLNATKSLQEMNATIYECSLVVNDCYSILSDYISTKFPNSEAPEDATEEG